MLKYLKCVLKCSFNKMGEEVQKRVCIVVLGDIGRSPRMQYHGLSFLEEGYNVEFVGYPGSEPIKKLHSHRNIKFNYVRSCPDFKTYLPTLLAYVMKVFWQFLTLFIALLRTNYPDYMLVQNPPSIPTLCVCFIFCKIVKCKFIIDWHNYGHSLLALSLHENHALVKISKRFEFYFGTKADSNICVTKSMKEDLEINHNIKAVTFYDRPPDFFKSPTIKEKHNLFLNLGLEYEIFVKDCKPGETVFTKVSGDSEITLKDNRPGLLISSTSWTEDENFYSLLTALEGYEKAAETSNLPDLLCVITGKGPLKDFYKKVISSRIWSHVHIITPWLEAEDYPVLLGGSADLGVCLHTSSSGLDLPMKVVDMFGCLVPVCAVNFKCLSELVIHEKNGFIFNSDEELLKQIKNWFTGFPNSNSELRDSLKENIKKFVALKWHDNWKFNIQPLF